MHTLSFVIITLKMFYHCRTDWDNERIIYSQYFPEKWLNGNYEFKVSFIITYCIFRDFRNYRRRVGIQSVVLLMTHVLSAHVVTRLCA